MISIYNKLEYTFQERVEDIINHMNIKEKISQLFNISLAIERFDIPRYDWRNECIHGVAFAGYATVFPQAIGMAASWNPKLVQNVANAISTEARAKHIDAVKKNQRVRYKGLTFAAPNINIFRDPRWGRGQETFGEDPYLTSRMGVAFVKGLQGNHSKYIKTVSEPKHFAVHSGPENRRHEIDIKVNKKDLWETYLPAFEACIIEGGAKGVMGAYNRLNGEPCCSNSLLLKKILRERWGFNGYVIGDGGAVTDIYTGHELETDFGHSVTRALKGGLNIINPLNIMTEIKIKRLNKKVENLVNKTVLDEEIIDQALKEALLIRFKLGVFDPPHLVPYSNIPIEIVNCKKHQELALRMAHESIVLLKNQDMLLPLNKKLNSVAIIGPNADHLEALLGDYHGTPKHYVTPLQDIKNIVPKSTKVYFSKGCEHVSEMESNELLHQEALDVADKAEIIIACLGLTGKFEGEEGFVLGPLKGDRKDLNLPSSQEILLREICSLGKPVILILMNGGAMSINFAKENVPAIIETWYPGEKGGKAISDVLFGNLNPSGKLPVTFYKSVKDLPDYEDYSMKNRTYRFFPGETLFPFGYGLSYSHFQYENLKIHSNKIKIGETVKITVDLINNGPCIGQEVVQLYISNKKSLHNNPLRELKAFQKNKLNIRQKKKITFTLTPHDYSSVNDEGERVIEKGIFEVFIGEYETDLQKESFYPRGSFQVV